MRQGKHTDYLPAACGGNQCGLPAPAVVLREAALVSDRSNVCIPWMLGQVGAGVITQSCPCRTRGRCDNWDAHRLPPISWVYVPAVHQSCILLKMLQELLLFLRTAECHRAACLQQGLPRDAGLIAFNFAVKIT